MANIAASIATLIVFIITAVIMPLLFSRSIRPQQLLRKPAWAAVAAGFFVLIGFAASFIVFYSFLSIVMVALASLLLMPYLIEIFGGMETHITRGKGLLATLKRHERLLVFYTWLFFGMSLIWGLLYAVLPPILGSQAFSAQLSLLGPRAAFFQPDVAIALFANNIQLALFAFALSPFWGAGSLFLLGYIASLAGVVYGSPLRALLYGAPSLPVSPFFLPHTILEILGYLFAAVAGVALIKKVDKDSLTDAGWLLAVGAILIALGAVVESGLL
jgi:uncharacterized membrane protein SpoIIM required for sporulation